MNLLGAKSLLPLMLAAALAGRSAEAYDPQTVEVPNQTPKELSGIGIDEHLGSRLDLTTPLVDDAGKPAPLGSYFKSGKPVLLTVVYYGCESLCNFHLNGLTEAMRKISWTAGKEFELVAISMDDKEGPELAGPKKANYLKSYGRPESAEGWHFLTGSKASIAKITSEIGFKFRWDEATKQFAHASAAVIVTPDGVISRYLHGIDPHPQTLRLALLEAGGGKIGSFVDQLILYCFHFDPHKSKYTIYAWNIMRVGVVAMLLLMAIILVPLWRRERRSTGPV
jgi:protein SCO1